MDSSGPARGAAPRQLAFELAGPPGFSVEDFFVSGSNEQAFALVERWPDWPDPVLLLLGPAGSGKSHLGAIWAARAEGRIIPASALAAADVEAQAAGALLVEDLETLAGGEAALFHLVNLMRERRHGLVLTAKRPPDALGLKLADLRSRLRLAPSVEISAPDDSLMRAVLVKLLVDRQLSVDIRVVDYAALRLERSLDSARRFVEALDREALSRKSRVTRLMAGEVLRAMEEAAEQADQGPT